MKAKSYTVSPKLLLTLLLAVVLPSFLLVLLGARAVRNERYVLEHKMMEEYRRNLKTLKVGIDNDLSVFESSLPERLRNRNSVLHPSGLSELIFILAPDGRITYPVRLVSRREIPAAFLKPYSDETILQYQAEYRSGLLAADCPTLSARKGTGSALLPREALRLASDVRCLMRNGEFPSALKTAFQLMADSLSAPSPLTVSSCMMGGLLAAKIFVQLGQKDKAQLLLTDCFQTLISDTTPVFEEEFVYYTRRIGREMETLSPEQVPAMVSSAERRLAENRLIRPLQALLQRRDSLTFGYAMRDSLIYYIAPAPAGGGIGAILKKEAILESVRRFEREQPHLGLSISTAEGEVLYSSFEREPGEENQVQLTDGLCGRLSFLNVRMAEKRPGELHGILRLHRYIYLSFLIILISAIAVGVWLTYRAVRRELAVIRMRSNFISSVSHELKTPLTSIRMFSEMLDRSRVLDEGKRTEYVGHIKRESERLTGLIDKMLDFSRVEEGRIRYEFEHADLEKIIDDALSALAPLLDEKDVFVDRVRSRSLFVFCDRKMAAQVVVNLVDNAVKYSTGRREVEIRTGLQEGMAVCSIRDYGMGIQPGEAERIFDEFYRSENGTAAQIKGTGLGLAIARKIILDHKGTIMAEPALGGGLRVAFCLPVSEGEAWNSKSSL